MESNHFHISSSLTPPNTPFSPIPSTLCYLLNPPGKARIKEEWQKGRFLSSVYDYLNLVRKAERGVTLYMWILSLAINSHVLFSPYVKEESGISRGKVSLAQNITQNRTEIILSSRMNWSQKYLDFKCCQILSR